MSESAMGSPVLTWEDITPDQARAILSGPNGRETINRSLTGGHVKRLANDMLAGRWITNTNPIKIDWNGSLINGQHRMNALIQSGQTIRFLIARNCDPSEFNVDDTGLKRSDSDIEYIAQGGSVSNQVLRLHMAVSGYMVRGYQRASGGSNLSSSQKREFYHRHQETITWAVETAGTRKNGVRSTVLLAVIGRASYTNDRGALEHFINVFRDGNVDFVNSPIGKLRDVYLQQSQRLSGMTMKSFYAKSQAAVLAHLQKREMRALKGIEKEIFLLPEESE